MKYDLKIFNFCLISYESRRILIIKIELKIITSLSRILNNQTFKSIRAFLGNAIPEDKSAFSLNKTQRKSVFKAKIF